MILFLFQEATTVNLQIKLISQKQDKMPTVKEIQRPARQDYEVGPTGSSMLAARRL